jgi:hypothetical protein
VRKIGFRMRKIRFKEREISILERDFTIFPRDYLVSEIRFPHVTGSMCAHGFGLVKSSTHNLK